MPQLRSCFTTPSHVALLLALVCSPALFAQNAQTAGASPATGANAAPVTHYLPAPAFDLSSINKAADPCTDFYKFACGNFAANHPIPADQPDVDQFYLLYNVNTQDLNGILTKFSDRRQPARTAQRAEDRRLLRRLHEHRPHQSEGPRPHPAALRPDRQGLQARPSPPSPANCSATASTSSSASARSRTSRTPPSRSPSSTRAASASPSATTTPAPATRTSSSASSTSTTSPRCSPSPARTPEQAATDAKNILAFETELAKASLDRHRPARPREDLPPPTLADLREAQACPAFNFASFFEGHPLAPGHLDQQRQPELLPRHGRSRPCRRHADHHAPTCATTLLTTFARNLPASIRRRELRLLRPHPQRPARAASPLEALLLRRRSAPSARPSARSTSTSTSPATARPRPCRWSTTSRPPWTRTSTRSTG